MPAAKPANTEAKITTGNFPSSRSGSRAEQHDIASHEDIVWCARA